MGLVRDKISKRIPKGFKASDPARHYRQAFDIARVSPPDMPAIVVKTGKKGGTFPYTIYVKKMYGDKNATKRLRKIYNK